MNSHETRIQILAALQRCGSHKLPENALIETIQQLSAEDIAKEEVRIEIHWLEAKGWIDFTKDPMGSPEKRWFITDEGRKRLK